MTGSKKNLLAAGLILLTLLLLSSCTKEDILSGIPPGNSLYVATAIIAPGNHTETEAATRVLGDEVPVAVTAGSLGVFRSKGTGYAEALNNKKYTYTGADNGWQPATTADTLFLNGDDAQVCAYYPYNADASYQDATALPLVSGKYTGTGALHDPNDLCFDINRMVNAVRRATTFEMKHALALLEFRISKEASYSDECRITSISILNPEMLSETTIDITAGTYGTPTKGTVTYNPGADADGLLIETTAATTGALLVPFTPTADGLTIAFTANDTPVEAAISATELPQLEAGRRYRVNVIMKTNSMRVTGVDMMPWEEVGVGGDDYTWYPGEEKEKVIDIGLDFVFAPGNLKAIAKTDGSSEYKYSFTGEQAEYAINETYFAWGNPDPRSTSYPSSTNFVDVCKKINDQWRTPTKEELVLIGAIPSVWGEWIQKNGTKVKGRYFGTATVPNAANRDKYLFVAAAGTPEISSTVGITGYITSSGTGDGYSSQTLIFNESEITKTNDLLSRGNRKLLRCVRDKTQPEPIDIDLGFWIAPGNLKATKQKDNTYKYTFAYEQGYYSYLYRDGTTVYESSAGDYFCWNTLDPEATAGNTGAWDDALDPCRKVDEGNWHTPTKEQLQALIDAGSVWGVNKNIYNSTSVNGRYFGITGKVPNEANQDKYVFLPAAGYINDIEKINRDAGSFGDYWSCTPEFETIDPDYPPSYKNAWNLDFGESPTMSIAPSIANFDRMQRLPIRCVKDKPIPKPEFIDLGLDFVIAPGNLVATDNGSGGDTYVFADEQGAYTGNLDGGDYFAWNTLEPGLSPSDKYSDWDDTQDPCHQIDDVWCTPTKTQWDAIISTGSVWGTWRKSDGTTINGRYFGTTTVPDESERNKFVFLPAAGYEYSNTLKFGGVRAAYRSSTNEVGGGIQECDALWFSETYVPIVHYEPQDGYVGGYSETPARFPLRCVRAK